MLRQIPASIHGLAKRKKLASALNGMSTVKTPPALITSFVTGIHSTGGVKLVAQVNVQSLAQSGQLTVSEFALLDALNAGSGRNTAKASELVPVPQGLLLAIL